MLCSTLGIWRNGRIRSLIEASCPTASIAVTHEMGFAREVADRLVFMESGEVVEVGTPEHFFTNPQEERTKLFLSQIL